MSYTLAGLLLLAASPAAGNALHTEIEAIRAALRTARSKTLKARFCSP